MTRLDSIHLLTKRLIVMAGTTLLCMVIVFAYTYSGEETSRLMLSWLAFFAGILGGFVSIQQRLGKAHREELTLLTKGWFQILLIPIFGGIFALVLYTIFMSQIIQSDFFPVFSFPNHMPDESDVVYMRRVLVETGLPTGADLGKLLFWSFVAGFSERFVPQIISKASKDAIPDDDDGDGKTDPQVNPVK